jgi:hypothetical protein
MARNRSRAKAGHRSARSAHRSSGNKSGITLRSQGKLTPTDLVSAAKVTSNSSLVKLTFNQPITIGDPASPSSGDITMSGTSATTRNGISTTPVDFVSVRVALSGALTAGKTYNLTVAAAQGLIVPNNGVWGKRTATFAT